MAIVIDDATTVEQIERLAARMHVTPVQAVESAVPEKVASAAEPPAPGRGSPEEIARAIREIQQRVGARPELDNRNPDEILGYNEHGHFD